MDNVHSTHGTTGVVEHPLLLEVQVVDADLGLKLGDNEVDDGIGIIAMGLDGTLRQVVQVLWVEDVELVQARVEVAVDGGEQGQDNGEDAKVAEGEAATAAARRLLRGLGRHLDVVSQGSSKARDEKYP